MPGRTVSILSCAILSRLCKVLAKDIGIEVPGGDIGGDFYQDMITARATAFFLVIQAMCPGVMTGSRTQRKR
jgi:hypothetical protein